MPNQPAVGVHGHYISAIPDELWADAAAIAAVLGESVSAAMRRGLEEYVQQNRHRLEERKQ